MHNDFNLILDMRLQLSRAQGCFEGLAKSSLGPELRQLCQDHADAINAVLEKHFPKMDVAI